MDFPVQAERKFILLRQKAPRFIAMYFASSESCNDLIMHQDPSPYWHADPKEKRGVIDSALVDGLLAKLIASTECHKLGLSKTRM